MKKRLLLLLKVVLALALTGALVFATLLALVLNGSRDEIVGAPKVMIVLGCQLHEWGPSILLRDRLDKALAYWEDHPDVIVVVSGGQGPNEPTSEARGMADYLTQRGIPRENILLEEESHNTNSNLRCSRQVLEQAGYSLDGGVILVSNGFHLTRAKLLAGRVGFTQVSTLAAPSSHTATRLWMYIREPIALVKSFFLDR